MKTLHFLHSPYKPTCLYVHILFFNSLAWILQDSTQMPNHAPHFRRVPQGPPHGLPAFSLSSPIQPGHSTSTCLDTQFGFSNRGHFDCLVPYHPVITHFKHHSLSELFAQGIISSHNLNVPCREWKLRVRQAPDTIQHKVCHTRGQNSFLVMVAHKNDVRGKIKPIWNWEQNWVLKKELYIFILGVYHKIRVNHYQT